MSDRFLPIPPAPFTSGTPNLPAAGPMGAYFPQVNNPFPYTLPSDPFNILVQTYGQNLLWCKSHTCACVAYPTPFSPAGSPNPSCLSCFGRGVYWDASVPFVGLLTFGHHLAGQGIEPGAIQDPKWGQIVEGQPWIALTQYAGVVYDEASEFDIFIESDSLMRFNTTLTSGPSGIIRLPYQQSLLVAASGAVSTWVASASAIAQVTGYVVSGTTITVPASYPSNTPYVVEFQAAPSYVAFRPVGGLPHNRPFSQGTMAYPKRFRLQPLDLWLREQGLNSWGNPGGYGAPPG